MVRYSFPEGLFHSLFHAGLSRRTLRLSAFIGVNQWPDSVFQQPANGQLVAAPAIENLGELLAFLG
jgi:hypothetical protein